MSITRPARALPILLLLMPAAAPIAAAQQPVAQQPVAQQPVTLDPLVVTATRVPTPLSEVGSSVTVITAEEIRRRQHRTLAEALRGVPGLAVVQSGGTGKTSSVFVRGTNSNHVLVLLDGIEINDPSTSGGLYDFGHMLTGAIERIEVVRGPLSTLYGSDAIGGVINIITRRPGAEPSFGGTVEAGSFATRLVRGHGSGRMGAVDYALTLERLQTNGTSITPARMRPAGADDEADGYENFTATARVGIDLGEATRLGFTGRFVDASNDLDVSPEDPNSTGDAEQIDLRAELSSELLEGRWRPNFAVSMARYDRHDSDPPDALSASSSTADYLGTRLAAELQNDLYLVDGHVFTIGLAAEREAIDTASTFSSGFTTSTDADAETLSLFVQDQVSFGESLSGSVGARLDHHSEFGTEATWRGALAYSVAATGTRLHAAAGTGFKAPTLYQLYGGSSFAGFTTFTGNPELQPEESLGIEAGVEQVLPGWPARVGATAFFNRIRNLIVSTADFGSVENRARARTYGVETFAEAEYGPLLLRLDYTWLRAEDADTGGDLLRRPRHTIGASARYAVTDAWSVGTQLQMVNRLVDVDAVTFQNKQVSGYTVVDLTTDYRLDDTFTAFARLENLLDRDYEYPDGFQHPGRAVYAGFTARF